jgi:hypothetical protein
MIAKEKSYTFMDSRASIWDITKAIKNYNSVKVQNIKKIL